MLSATAAPLEVAAAELEAVEEPLVAAEPEPEVVEAAAELLAALDEVEEAALLELVLAAEEAFLSPQVRDWHSVIPSRSLGWPATQLMTHCWQM